MKKRTRFLLLILVTHAFLSFGQEISSNDTATVKILRNQVGINIVPALTALMGGYSWGWSRFAVTYKRAKSEKRAIRFGAAYYFYEDGTFTNEAPYKIIRQTDSTQYREEEYRSNYNRFQVSAGYERMKGKRKVKRFFGVDFIAGYYFNSITTIWSTFVIDSVSNPGYINWVSNTGFSLTEDSKHIEYNRYYAGISPFYGFYVPVNKKISLSINLGIDVRYELVNRKTSRTGLNSYTSSEERFFSLDADAPGIIHDCSLIFLF